ncbi:MAG: ABC transporter permease [Phycisphaerae bacterium]|nr:ABC transporter permease [Phycisphaerae bacterium]
MTNLALANLRHHRFRTALVGLGVAIGVGMLVTMLALSHGTLGEVAQRVKSVRADLIVLPAKSSLVFSDGAPLSDKFESKLGEVSVDGRRVVQRVVPVFLGIVSDMAGQQQRVFGVDEGDFDVFAGNRRLVEGEVFPQSGAFKRHVEELAAAGESYHPDEVDEAVLSAAAEMIIDERLAAAGGYEIGDTITFLGRPFAICGVVEAGLAGRVFVPIQVIRHIQNAGMAWSSLFFLQVDRELVRSESEAGYKGSAAMTVDEAAALVSGETRLRVEPLEKYDQMLFNSFKPIYVYINIANGIVLLVSFLFIMVTMYTMVLERRREIGVLRSMGAGAWYIMGQTVVEALVISLSGTAAGVGLALAAKWAIEHYRPLLTVDIRPAWLVTAVAVGIVGGVLSALYPGYRALRLDPVECLTYE